MMYLRSVWRFAEPYNRLSVQAEVSYGQAYELMHDLRNHGRTKNGIKEVVHRLGMTHVSGGSRRVEEKDPPDPHRAVYSGVGIVLYGFQMRGLEIMSASHEGNGRGLDSSLKGLLIFI